MVNRLAIGLAFEKEAFGYLKKIFDKVEWLSSKNMKSSFDFKCWRNGVPYNVDAKHFKIKIKNIRLRYSQREADYLIVKNNGKIELWDKSKINSNCKIDPKLEKIKTIKNLPLNTFQIIRASNYSHKIRLTAEYLRVNNLQVGDIIDFDITKITKYRPLEQGS